jgi:hypothetical protein
MRRSNDTDGDDVWQRLWHARLAALETVLGPAEDAVYHSPIPFYLDGGADVVVFTNHNEGVVYVTADLIGDDRSKPSEVGQYELMICLREDADWAAALLSWLAKYTIDAVLSPYDTMDIGPALPQPTQLVVFLFVHYATVTVDERTAGILLCLGITQDELTFARKNGPHELMSLLKRAGVYPFTDLSRCSVLQSGQKA